MKKNHSRDSFASRWGFILACIGSAVGMGNIWMFPTRVSKFGGGSFLLAYFLFVFVIGFSGVIGEMAFGRATRSGPIGAFSQAVASRGKNPKIGAAIGFIPVLGSLALAIGYSVVMGWILRYLVASLTGEVLAPTDIDGFSAMFGSTASPFGNNLYVILSLVIAFIIMAFGIASGIEKANKIMMPLFFLLFLGLAVYMFFQPGAAEGYRYMFRIDPEAIRQKETWVYALGQAFFSLSLAGNGTLIYGSYLRDDEDIIGSAWKVALFDTLAAMLAALVIIPAMATAGSQLNSGGPGLMFIFLPALFQSMPGSRLIVIVFFVGVFLAGMTSLINLYEAPTATIQEKFGLSRPRAVLVIAAIGTVISVCIQGIVEGWMNFVSIYVCPLGAGLAGIMFYWVYGEKFVREQVQKGRMKPIGRWLEPMTKFVFCGLTIAVFILGVLTPGGIG
ncbi:MAG: sodium-dependent transporter [Butyricicoccus pullicaecorum]|nr:sodium-dependent transporter [Butyricicoccus pullicaecorum]